MKAIEITQENKDKNGKILEYYNVGDIFKPSKMPKSWNGIVGLKSPETDQEYYDFGFRDLVEPILSQYERNGAIYFDIPNDVFTYEIVSFSQDEIDTELEYAAYKVKYDLIVGNKSVIWHGKSNDGLRNLVLLLKNDDKVEVVEII